MQSRRVCRVWSQEELARFRTLYTDDNYYVLMDEFNRTKAAIQRVAFRLGLRKRVLNPERVPRKRPVPKLVIHETHPHWLIPDAIPHLHVKGRTQHALNCYEERREAYPIPIMGEK